MNGVVPPEGENKHATEIKGVPVIGAQVKLIDTIIRDGLKSGSKLKGNYLGSSDNGEWGFKVYWRTFSPKHVNIENEEDRTEALYAHGGSVFPAVLERAYEQEPLLHKPELTSEEIQLLEKRARATFMVVFRYRDATDPEYNEEYIKPDDFLYILLPEEVAKGYQELRGVYPVSHVPIRTVAPAEKTMREFNKFTLKVPDYESELIAISKEYGPEFNFTGIRLPIEDKDLQQPTAMYKVAPDSKP